MHFGISPGKIKGPPGIGSSEGIVNGPPRTGVSKGIKCAPEIVSSRETSCGPSALTQPEGAGLRAPQKVHAVSQNTSGHRSALLRNVETPIEC